MHSSDCCHRVRDHDHETNEALRQMGAHADRVAVATMPPSYHADNGPAYTRDGHVFIGSVAMTDDRGCTVWVRKVPYAAGVILRNHAIQKIVVEGDPVVAMAEVVDTTDTVAEMECPVCRVQYLMRNTVLPCREANN